MISESDYNKGLSDDSTPTPFSYRIFLGTYFFSYKNIPCTSRMYVSSGFWKSVLKREMSYDQRGLKMQVQLYMFVFFKIIFLTTWRQTMTNCLFPHNYICNVCIIQTPRTTEMAGSWRIWYAGCWWWVCPGR
jgi:hypothetical protein